ncbi:Transposon Tf2-6 polyprotein [Labeo rohita]|uniref:Transposon Tf2-6 polyprotein n=1 Tax=Labeo rohita TaxID=84645 RepID=A0ABQ8M148_LABRO|nr:Transposon Tf2-6 polyprotein [Labeo rohita]
MLATGCALVAQVSELAAQLQCLKTEAARLPTVLHTPLDPPAPPLTFSTERSKMALDMSLLSGRVVLWGMPVWAGKQLREAYPLLLLPLAFEWLQGVSFFTKLDLRNNYHLVCIRKGNGTLNTPGGHFEYQIMPFSLSNSPAVFQAFVIKTCSACQAGSPENDLFVKVEKCVFQAQLVPFLRFFISSEGVCMDPDKVKAVEDWPTLNSHKVLQRIPGLALILVAPDPSSISDGIVSLVWAKTTVQALFRDTFSQMLNAFIHDGQTIMLVIGEKNIRKQLTGGHRNPAQAKVYTIPPPPPCAIRPSWAGVVKRGLRL